MRIFYNNEPGDPIRIIAYSGTNFIWFPKGEVWAKRKNVTIKKFVDKDTGRRKDQIGNRWEKVTDEGELAELAAQGIRPKSVSFIDMPPEAWVWVSRNVFNADGKLMTEDKYREVMDITDIDIQIAELQQLKAAKGGKAKPPPKKDPPLPKVDPVDTDNTTKTRRGK